MSKTETPKNPFAGPHDQRVCGLQWHSDCPDCRRRNWARYFEKAIGSARKTMERYRATNPEIFAEDGR